MKSVLFTVLAALILAAAPAQARSGPPELWLGAWGISPLSPAQTAQATRGAPIAGAAEAAGRRGVTEPNAGAADTPRGAVPPVLTNVTVHQLVRVSVAGNRLRLRFTNEAGTDPMRIGSAHIARAGADGSIIPGSDHVLTFNGQSSVTIFDGSPMLSDPVDMKVAALEKLAVSVFSPDDTSQRGKSVLQYVSQPGDFGSMERLPGARTARVGAYVSAIEVVPTIARYTVVALGDSITETSANQKGEFLGWSDMLAERLAATPTGRYWSVVNAGIGGNRLLRNIAGQSALTRFDRDVLGAAGVRAVIVLEGFNDISRHLNPVYLGQGDQTVTLDALINADKQLIARAHAHGIRVIGATLTPYKGGNDYAPDDDLIRKAFNQWIRTSGAFDGVADFEAAVRDPADPDRMPALYNDTDHIHPNAAGHAAMVRAIDLKFLPARLPPHE